MLLNFQLIIDWTVFRADYIYNIDLNRREMNNIYIIAIWISAIHLDVIFHRFCWLISLLDRCQVLTLFSYLECGGPLTNNSGTITSPSYPHPYGVDLNCTWTIKKTVYISIKELVLDAGDQLLVYDGATDGVLIHNITETKGWIIEDLGYAVLSYADMGSGIANL